MSNISISNLSPAGSDLFSDNESYMLDVADSDLGQVIGGRPWWHWTIVVPGSGLIVATIIYQRQ
jgi:hypothetical protein